MGEASATESVESILDCEQINGLVAAAGVDGTRDILDAFRRSTDTLFQTLQDQLASGDLVEVAKSAHALKGSSLNVGAMKLSAAARKIEEYCRNQDSAAAQEHLAGAKADYAETIAAFDAHLAAAA